MQDPVFMRFWGAETHLCHPNIGPEGNRHQVIQTRELERYIQITTYRPNLLYNSAMLASAQLYSII